MSHEAHHHEDGCTHACGHAHHDAEALVVHRHEDALVATLRLELPGPPEAARATLTERLALLTAAIKARGGIIGHIKGSLELSETSLFFTTGGPPEFKAGVPAAGRVTLVAILLSMEEAQVREAITECMLPTA